MHRSSKWDHRISSCVEYRYRCTFFSIFCVIFFERHPNSPGQRILQERNISVQSICCVFSNAWRAKTSIPWINSISRENRTQSSFTRKFANRHRLSSQHTSVLVRHAIWHDRNVSQTIKMLRSTASEMSRFRTCRPISYVRTSCFSTIIPER